MLACNYFPKNRKSKRIQRESKNRQLFLYRIVNLSVFKLLTHLSALHTRSCGNFGLQEKSGGHVSTRLWPWQQKGTDLNPGLPASSNDYWQQPEPLWLFVAKKKSVLSGRQQQLKQWNKGCLKRPLYLKKISFFKQFFFLFAILFEWLMCQEVSG